MARNLFENYSGKPRAYQNPAQPNALYYMRSGSHDPIRPYDTRRNYDIRLIMYRHAERLDQSVGKDWYVKIFGNTPSAPPEAFRHQLLPHHLPYRKNTLMYEFDPPISRQGEIASQHKGQELLQTGAKIDYCYSSPASRAVLTASAILQGMNQKNIPIRVETELFEPMNWNSALRLLGNADPFLSADDWKKAGYNVDRHYRPLMGRLPMYGTEYEYHDRSKGFFDNIIKLYGNAEQPAAHAANARRRINILIVGHASTPEILSGIALGKKFDAEALAQKTSQIPYLHSVVLERDPNTRCWTVPSKLLHD